MVIFWKVKKRCRLGGEGFREDDGRLKVGSGEAGVEVLDGMILVLSRVVVAADDGEGVVEEGGWLERSLLLALEGLVQFALEFGKAAFFDSDLGLLEHELFAIGGEIWEVGEELEEFESIALGRADFMVDDLVSDGLGLE